MIRNLGFAGAIAAMLAVTPAVLAQDADDAPERRALLVSIIEGLGCKVDGVSPPPASLNQMKEHAFTPEETNAIAADLYGDGLAERSGPTMILNTENCS